jgi:ABC-type amino acid transport substrate-binding protein
MVSVIEIASLSLFITLSCRHMILLRWGRILKNGLFTVLPILLVFFGIKLFNPLPEIKNEIKSIYELNIASSIPVKIYKTSPTAIQPSKDTFDRILETKIIRVGYNPNCPPFCFLNVDGNIVGYDIAFAYDLAYALGCQLDLVPLDYHQIVQELNENYYDIAMSAVTVNESRLKSLMFTEPYISPRLVLVVQEKMRKQFKNIDNIITNKKIKIAVLKGSSFETTAKEIFPDTQIVHLDHYNQFEKCDPHTALLWEETEAMAWTLCHRNFRIIFYNPPLGVDTLSYALRSDSTRFLHYLNQWLELKKAEGFTEKQYNLWIKGKTEIAAPPEPRWSVVRNVLHWVD